MLLVNEQEGADTMGPVPGGFAEEQMRLIYRPFTFQVTIKCATTTAEGITIDISGEFRGFGVNVVAIAEEEEEEAQAS